MNGDISGYCKDLPFWDDLDRHQQELVLGSAFIAEYEEESVIHSMENECLGVIKLISGKARSFMLSEEGREISLYKLGKGDIDVLSASCVLSQITFETQMVADTACTILVIPAGCMSELKEKNLKLRCFIYEKLGERFSDVMKAMEKMLFTSVEGRIAACLLKKKSEIKGNIIEMTHEMIAREINSSREVASRKLKQFEKKGIVKLHRGKLEITDIKKLRDLI